MFCAYTSYQVSVYRTIGPLVSCIPGHTEEIKMAAVLLTAGLKTFNRN